MQDPVDQTRACVKIECGTRQRFDASLGRCEECADYERM